MDSYQKVGNYIILERLNEQGGMGEISLAIDSRNNHQNELLTIKAGAESTHNNIEMARQLQNEAQLASKLKHPNICSYKDSFVHEGRFYYIRKYINGISLRKIMSHNMEKQKSFTLPEAIYIALEIGKGLTYLHEFVDPANGIHRGIVHGDLTPSNILFDNERKINLIDFGLSRPIKDYSDVSLHSDFASISYVSLRRLSSKTVARTDDIVALGFIFWELLTNSRYYGDKTRSEIIEEVKKSTFFDPRQINPNIPEAVVEFIRKCFVSDTVFGYSSIEAATKDLQSLLHSYGKSFDPSLFWSKFFESFQDNFQQLKSSAEQNLLKGQKVVQSHLKAKALEEIRTPKYRKVSREFWASLKKWAFTFTPADRRLLKIVFSSVVVAEVLWFGGSRWFQSNQFHHLLVQYRLVPQSIRIVSQPAGGRISLNGVELNLKTPADIILPEDRKVFLISIRDDHYPTYTFNVPASAKEIQVDMAQQQHVVQSR